MTRFRVVDPLEEPHAELEEVTLRSTDGSDLNLPVGTELLIPEEADLSVIRGVPIEDIDYITLDGRTWINVRPVYCHMSPGGGKTLVCEVVGAPKRLNGMQAFSVAVGRVLAVGHQNEPTRRKSEP